MGIYNVCSNSAASGSLTLAQTVGSGSGSPVGANTGDLVVVFVSNSGAASQAIQTPTDTQSNTYVLIPGLSLGAANSPQMSVYACFTVAPLVAGVDVITGHWAVTGSSKCLIVKGCDGVSSATADKAVGTTGSGTAPSSGSSGALTQAAEAVFGAIDSAAAGGTPTGLSFGTGLTVSPGAILTEFDELVNATTAQTASGTIVSAAWIAAIATFKLTAPSVTTASPLPAGTQGSAYSQTLAESGGTNNFTWSVTAGSLSGSGLSLSSAGVLSGTAGTPATYTFTATVTDGAGQTASKSLSVTINAAPSSLFPANPLPIVVEILLNGTWTDISSFVYQRDTIQISGGVSAQGSTNQPATCTMTLNNQDGRFTPGNAIYPALTRNIQLRVSVQGATSSAGATYTGYRFWGTVADWPPTSDQSGQDVYVQITASGPLRQIGLGSDQDSPLFRYYQNLLQQDAVNGTSYAPVAYWPVEDDIASLIIGSGVPGGVDMTVAAGTPVWKASSDFPGSGPVARINKSTWTGVTSAFGTSGDDIFDTPGTYQWIASTTTVNVRCWGGGGGGTKGQSPTGGGNGGGGGEFAQEATLAVTPGKVYTVVVGAGGAQGNWNLGGSAGGSSSIIDPVTSTVLCVANGGAGATANGNSGGQSAGGTGSVNTVHKNGGNGGFNSGNLNGGAGGGGSGGASTAGGAGSNSVSGNTAPGGSAGTGTPAGAAGGFGGYQISGQTGRLPGGGGGGGWANSVGGVTLGGNGASGQVELLYAAGGGGGSQVLTSGSQWVAPAGVTSVKVECVGGGGGGGATNSAHTSSAAGGGGGGEYAAEATLAVTAGNTYSYSIGAAGGGGAGTTGANGSAGGNTTFAGNSVTVTAHGGSGGAGASASNGTGGAGGTGSVNTTVHPGGAGAAGSGGAGGGAGGSGGSGSTGNAASGQTGGAAVTGGGPGANGGPSGGSGSTPFSGPGGGGGGDGQYGTCVDRKTEILTRRGWLTWDEVRAGDEAMSTEGWSAISKVHDHPETFETVTFSGAVSAVATLNHRWLTRRGYVTTAALEDSDEIRTRDGWAAVGSLHREPGETAGVWCVTSEAGNWLARRDGTEYFTGNKPGTGGSGFKGQITVTTGAGAGTQPPWNVVRFMYETPTWGIYPANSVVLRILTTSTALPRVDVIGVSGGKLQLKGWSSPTGGTNLFTSSNLTVGDGVPVMVSVELNNSGTSIAYAMKAIGTSGFYDFLGSVTGTQATASIGSVSQVIVCPNADITKAVVSQISVQYQFLSLYHVSAAFTGNTTEMGIDRFIRLCSELSMGSETEFNETADHWGFESGTQSWVGTNCALTNPTTKFTPASTDLTFYSSWPVDGTHSLLLTANGSGQPTATSPTGQSGQPVHPGDIVSAGAEFYVPAALSHLFTGILWYKSDGTASAVTAEVDSADTAVVLGGMAGIYVKGTAPSDAAYFAIKVGDHNTDAANTLIYVDNVRVSPQMGTQTRDNYRQYLQQVEDLEQGMMKEAKDIWGLKYKTRISLINQSPAVVLDYSQNQVGGDYNDTLLAPVFDDKLTANSITVHRHNGSRVTVTLDQGAMSTQLPPSGVGKHGKQASVMASDDAQLLAMAQHLLNLGTVTDERYPDIAVNLARPELAATGLFDTIPNVEIGDYIQVINLASWFPSATANQLVVGYTETLNAFQWDIDFNCQPYSPYQLTATSIRRW